MTKKANLCSHCGSNHKVGRVNKQGNYYCHKHYMQMKRYGYIKEKTYRDVHEYKITEDGDSVEIFVRNNQSKIVNSFFIDKSDLQNVLSNAWRIMGNGYVHSARTRTKESPIYLHRLLLNASEGDMVDHIDRNPLNNRKSNLRIVTQSQNMMNSSVGSDNTSGAKGVYFNKKTKKWYARISINKKTINLGTFNCFEDAYNARAKAEEKYHGEYKPNIKKSNSK